MNPVDGNCAALAHEAWNLCRQRRAYSQPGKGLRMRRKPLTEDERQIVRLCAIRIIAARAAEADTQNCDGLHR